MEQVFYEEGQRYIIPTSDWGFKRLFGTEANKKILIGFLNNVIDDCVIEDLEYLDRDVTVTVGPVRRVSFDVYCRCADGSRVIVEMQNYARASFVNRALVYTAASILENYTYSKKTNYRVNRTYLIAITGEKVFPQVDRAPVRIGLCNLDSPETVVLSDRILQIFIELPKFANDVSEIGAGGSFLDKFSVAMKKMATFDRMPEEMEGDLFEELFAAADMKSLNASDKDTYLKSVMNEFEYIETLKDYREEGLKEGLEKGMNKGLKKGLQQGRKEGEAKGKAETALAMLVNGLDIALVSKCTGLSEQQIRELQKL